MPKLLRKLNSKRRWDKCEPPSWLEEGHLKADPLADLNTSGNRLSVYHIEDDQSNLDQVITALASTRDHADKMDFALFDLQLLAGLGIKMESSEGNTLLDGVNACHRDLIELTGERLLALAKTIMEHGETDRCSEGKVIALILQAVDSGNLDPRKLKPKLQDKCMRERK